MSNLNLKGIWIPIEILTDNKYNNKINNKYNGNNNFSKKNIANFEQRDYSDFDFTKIYANVNAFT